MGDLVLFVLLIFVVLFAIAVPTVISDLKTQRHKDIAPEARRPAAEKKQF